METNPRIEAYRKVLEEFYIDPEDIRYSGGEDAAEYLSGERPIERFCVVTVSGEFGYAYALDASLENAKERAMLNITDDCFAETPVAIIDLDTGKQFVPKWSTVQWEEKR
jgi:hypothetical protein